MAGIKSVVVKKYWYAAKLPEDFEKTLAVYRSGVIYIEDHDSLYYRFSPSSIPKGYESYLIMKAGGGYAIVFSGMYSKWWLIRKAEQLIDKLFPIKYKITYYSK